MTDKTPGDFATVDAVACHVEKIVQGWASVIRCKAERYGGGKCDRIIMVVFQDFYQPPPDGSHCEWDSDHPMLCERCAVDLQRLGLVS